MKAACYVLQRTQGRNTLPGAILSRSRLRRWKFSLINTIIWWGVAGTRLFRVPVEEMEEVKFISTLQLWRSFWKVDKEKETGKNHNLQLFPKLGINVNFLI